VEPCGGLLNEKRPRWSFGVGVEGSGHAKKGGPQTSFLGADLTVDRSIALAQNRGSGEKIRRGKGTLESQSGGDANSGWGEKKTGGGER